VSESVDKNLYVVTVLVPARNEADVLADCLRSITAQSESGFELGVHWQCW